MYDQITLKLNVDPFILGALKEDITSEDVSTNSVMPEACMGKVELICKQDGIICKGRTVDGSCNRGYPCIVIGRTDSTELSAEDERYCYVHI